jgi:uncharacterized protein (DUF4415 family)
MTDHGTPLSCQDEILQSQLNPGQEMSSEAQRCEENVRQVTPAGDNGRSPGQRGRQKRPTKVLVTMRFSREVLDFFKATGDGWQTRINAALCHYVQQHESGKIDNATE